MDGNLMHSEFNCDLSEVDMVLLSRGCLYHSTNWENVLDEAFGMERSYIKTCWNNRIIAITPFYTRKKLGFKVGGSPLRGTFTEYLGPVFADSVDEATKVQIIINQAQFLKKMGYLYLEFGQLDSNEQQEILTTLLAEMGFVHTPRPSLILNLNRNKGAIWEGVSGRARNMCRKAEKNEVMANVETPDESTICDYFHFLGKTFNRQNSTFPYPKVAIQAILGNLVSVEKAYFVAARQYGKFVSGGIFLIDGQRAVFHSGCSSPEGLKTGASSLVQWTAIKEAHARGLHLYDFGGVGIPSIDKFKMSFSKQGVSHDKWIYSHSALTLVMRLIKWGYQKGLVRMSSN